MFRLEMLPACEGDCLILSWGDDEHPRRLLIDAGRKSTAAAVLAYAAEHQLGQGAFELFLVTHIDRDHIEGAVELLGEPEFRPLVKQVWFNGRRDLEYAPAQNEYETFGAIQGEQLTILLNRHEIRWNEPFGGAPAAIVEEGVLPQVTLTGGLKLTLLSPDLAQLRALADPWDETMDSAREGWETFGTDLPSVEDLCALRFKGDRAKPNGSSIALVAELDGRCVLLTGDAHVPRLLSSLDTYFAANPGHRFAAVKASHHGSRGNTSIELVKRVDAPLWAFSTNGDQFDHPDPEAVARVLHAADGPVAVAFNYRTDRNEIWASSVETRHPYTCVFGEAGYLALDIPALDE